MREIELKGVVPDEDAAIARITGAGAKEIFSGRLLDRRYDTPDRQLWSRDEVLRLRTAFWADGCRSRLDVKGPATYPDGYKVREELTTDVSDPDAMERALEVAGLIITREIERQIRTFDCCGAMVRFERYPRMDTLVEVEGDPATIEAAIEAIGIPRAEFTTERLADFVRRFEGRTGERAALSARELEGDYRYRIDDA
ncbi:MAG: class IV adenylate cyclase [Gemmatimonadota bacterium]